MMNRRQFVARAVGAGAMMYAGRTLLDAASPAQSVSDSLRNAEPVAADVIDAHAHFAGVLDNGKLPQGVADLLRSMDRCGIDLAFASSTAAINGATPDEFRAGNETTVAVAKAHPTRLKGYLVFQPNFLDASLAMSERLLDPSSGLVGFKLHGVSHNYPMDGDGYRRAYQFAHQHRLPVLFHLQGSNLVEMPTLRGEPLPAVLSRVVTEFTGMKLILAHFGRGAGNWVDFATKHPNVVIETAASDGSYRVLERTVARVGSDRILFGTDSTYLSPGGQLAKVVLADLSDEDKRNILALNARRVFGDSART
jgi:predicted TIM-barrel fold metal-dependent hydrolase